MKNELRVETIPEKEHQLYHFEDKIGTIEVMAKDEKLDNDILRIRSSKSAWFEINDLLPEGCKLRLKDTMSVFTEDYAGRAYYDSVRKIVVLNRYKMRVEGWKYLMSVLHEIGHAQSAFNNPEETDKIVELQNKYANLDADGLRQLEILTSGVERNAWAFSLKQFRNITKQLQISINEIFPTSETLRAYISKKLETYKAGAMTIAESFPEDIKEEVIKEFSNLYTHNNKRSI